MYQLKIKMYSQFEIIEEHLFNETFIWFMASKNFLHMLDKCIILKILISNNLAYFEFKTKIMVLLWIILHLQ